MDHIYNNPMVIAARKALTPEQLEEYKRIGEHMYNTDIYNTINSGSKVEVAEDEDLVIYATESLKAGLDPHDLTQKELRAMLDTYGDTWYTRFGFKEEDVPKPTIQVLRELKEAIEKNNTSRQGRRFLKRQQDKNRLKDRKLKEKDKEY